MVVEAVEAVAARSLSRRQRREPRRNSRRLRCQLGDYRHVRAGKHGGIRLFIAGDEQGTTYSILHTGGHIMLDGQLQIVLEPDLFGFVPTVGETFDMIESPNGISIAEGLSFANFVTVAGVNDPPFGLSLTHYNSGIEGDPDNLFQIGQTLFSYNLVDNDTVLRLTVEAVPEPKTLVLVGFGILGVVALAYCRRK